MPNIFISYSRTTKETALRIRRDLQLNGITNIFLDLDPIDGLAPGAPWARDLERHAKGSKVILLLVSKAWLASAACRQEYAWALEGRRDTSGGQPLILPLLLSDVRFADFGPADTADPEVRKTIAALPVAEQAAISHIAQLNAFDIQVSLELDPDAQRETGERGGGEQRRLQGETRKAIWSWLEPALAAADVVPQRVVFRDGQKPYPGLAALQERDAPVFFGREAEVEQLVEMLLDMRHRRTRNTLVIQAASGSGKSSLLRAGLLSRLKLAYRTEFYCLPTLTPGRAALSGREGLVDVLVHAFDGTRNYPADLYDDPATNPLPAFPRLQSFEPVTTAAVRSVFRDGVDAVEQMLRRLQDLASPLGSRGHVVDPVTLILPIDQAEELLPAVRGEDVPARLQAQIAEAEQVRALLAAMLSPLRRNVNLIVVLAIRSDSFPRLQEDHHLGGGIEKRLFDLSPMPIAAYSAVIEKPAELAKVTMDPKLVQRLLDDLAGIGDALPLLAFVLRRLYNTIDQKPAAIKTTIDLDDYVGDRTWSLGGLEGAIEKAVTRAIGRIGQDVPEALVRNLFISQLVTIDQDGRVLRRIGNVGEFPDGGREIADKLKNGARILTTRGDTMDDYEVAHEAVLRQWPRLTAWISEVQNALGAVGAAEGRAKAWFDNRPAKTDAEGRSTPEVIDYDRTLLPEQDNIDEIRDHLSTISRRLETLPVYFRAYLTPELERLERELRFGGTSHLRRAQIGDRIDALGVLRTGPRRLEFGDQRPGVNVSTTERIEYLLTRDVFKDRFAYLRRLLAPLQDPQMPASVPDIVWCRVPAGPITIQRDDGKLREWAKGADLSTPPVADPVEQEVAGNVYIARFPITLAQFAVFAGTGPTQVPDTYRDARWWDGLHATPATGDPMNDPGRQVQEQSTPGNYPAQYVTWYQAVAYCRWLTDLYRRLKVIPETAEIRLPFEAEWVMAATGGDGRRYPWGNTWDPSLCANQDGANRFVASGLYPLGASPVGAMDMAGNVYEWCLDAYDDLGNPALGEERPRATRGGSYYTQGMNRPTSHAVSVYHRFRDNPWGLTGPRDNDRSTRIAAGLRPVCVGLDPANPLVQIADR